MTRDSRRSVTVQRVEKGRYTAVNANGATLAFGEGDAEFSAIELLLTAIAGCTAADVDYITTKHAAPAQFEVDIAGDKVQDDDGNHLTSLAITFRVRFPDGESGDVARERLPLAVQRSHDRLCTVSRTVELGTPIDVEIA